MILSPIKYLNTLSLNSLKAKREIERESGRIYIAIVKRLASSNPLDYGPSIPVVTPHKISAVTPLEEFEMRYKEVTVHC